MDAILEKGIEAEDMAEVDSKLESMEEGFSITDPLRQYFHEIRSIPRLSPGQEKELIGRIEAGQDAKILLKGMDEQARDEQPEAVQEAEEVIHRATAAQRQLVEAHLGIAAYCAKKYANKRTPMLDLIQEANIALMKAAENVRYFEGARFVSYAMVCVKQAMKRAPLKEPLIHIPLAMRRAVHKVTVVSNAIEIRKRIEPTAEAIAQEMLLPVDVVHQVLEAQEMARRLSSLDVPIGDDGDAVLGDLVPNRSIEDPEEAAIMSALHGKVVELLDTLLPMERKIINLRFGIEDGCARTLEDVSQECQTSKENVIQFEVAALRKLRHPSRSRQLQGFLN